MQTVIVRSPYSHTIGAQTIIISEILHLSADFLDSGLGESHTG